MSTDKARADAAGGDEGLFAHAAAAAAAAPEAEGEATATGESPDAHGDAEAAPRAEAAAEVAGEASDARDASAAAPEAEAPEADGVKPAAHAEPLSPKSRILPDEDEPYNYPDCTVNINLQLLPDDGDAQGREVIVAVSSHIEGPLVELTRLTLLGPLPPLLVELLKKHEERLPALGAARAEQRQRETTRSTPARSKTTVRGSNGKTTAGKTSSGAAPDSSPTPAGPVAPILGEQTSLFDLKTGRRPKPDESSAEAGETSTETEKAPAVTPPASGD